MGTIKLKTIKEDSLSEALRNDDVSEVTTQGVENANEEQLMLQTEENVHVRHDFKPVNKVERKRTKIRKELFDERKLDEKTYENDDGTKKLEIYTVPVHFYNKSSEQMEEIDNTLELRSAEEYPFDFDGYVNKRNSFKAKFSKSGQPYRYVMEQDGHILIFSLNGYTKSSNNQEEIMLTPETTIGNKDIFLGSEIVYPEVFEGVDIKYAIISGGIKEYIIVKSKQEKYQFEFKINLKNIKPQISEDGDRLEFVSLLEEVKDKVIFNIPSPVIIDSNENICESVWYEIEEITGEEYILKIQGNPIDINMENTSFPILIDPEIETLPDITNALTVRRWYNNKMNNGYSRIGYYPGGVSSSSSSGSTNSYPYERLYLRLDLSELMVDGKITKVEFSANITGTSKEYYAMVGETNKNLDSSSTYNDNPDYPSVTDFNKISTTSAVYNFDITSIILRANQEGKTYATFVLKGLEENTTNPNLIVSSTKIVVSYIPGRVLDSSTTFDSSEVLRAGTGQINLFSGNLEFENKIVEWNGNRMPISIDLYFNNAYSDSHFTANNSISNIRCGYGWKLSLLQKIRTTTKDGYTFEYFDEKGTVHYLKKKENGANLYVDEDNSDIEYNSTTRTLVKNELSYIFDTAGDLICVKDFYNNQQEFLYNSNKQLVTVKDGINRIFTLSYSANKLLSISTPDSQQINFVYDGEKLSRINFADGYSAKYTYIGKNINNTTYWYLEKAINLDNNVEKFSVEYEYKGIMPKLVGVKEKNGTLVGKVKKISYESQTSTQVSESTDNQDEFLITSYSFDEEGNLVESFVVENEQQAETSASENLLRNTMFSDASYWSTVQGSGSIWVSPYRAYHGKNSLAICSCTNCNSNAYQILTLSAGTYTFSCYVQCYVTDGAAYIEVKDSYARNIGYSSSQINGEHQRLITTFTLSASTTVTLRLGNSGCGTAYFSAPQLEKASSAGEFNYLNSQVFKNRYLYGKPTLANTISQTIELNTSRTKKEEFIFSGWAKCYTAVDKERTGLSDSLFELRAELYYKDDTIPPDTEVAKFERNINDWQKVSLSISKTRYEKVSSIKVYFIFDNSVGTVNVKDFELIRNGEPVEVKYEDFEDESEDVGESGGSDAAADEEETASEVVDNSIDEFGNAKWRINHVDGEFGSIYQTFGYSSNGNDRTGETDSRNNETVYTYYENSSLIKTIKEPGRSLINYEYAVNRQISKIWTNIGTAQTPNIVMVNYQYDYLNNLSSISNNNVTYNIRYNVFGNLESIGIGENNLVSYEYNNGSGRIKKITYANGSTMTCNYNAKGYMLTETWKKADNTVEADYQYSYDANGNKTKTVDKTNRRMYTYSYEGETLKSIKVYELDSTLNQSTGVLLSEQSFSHNSSGKSIKTNVTVGGNSYDYEYSYYDEENDKYTLKLPDGSVSTAKTDHLGRKEFDELQLKSGFLSRRYSYTKGAYDADKLNGELKSLPTTDLVESITYENGEKQSYTYNESGDIVTVSLNGELKESYTYDALGRLKTEQNVESGYLTVYSYDNVGNIISKKKYVCQSSEIVTSESGLGTAEVRTYGYATDWKDKLISYNGQGITYDGNGNPTSYRGVTATWEKGRQLKSYGTNSYKYDENGIRISKTVNGTEHKYTLNGSNVVCEEYGTTKLDYLYDIGNSVCGMRVNNGTTYYFRKNLQGDITAITDNEGNIIARYHYDAWGKILSTTGNTEIANLNPFRYRGYYYDAETQLYYLQSRYYDPETCRFINADETEYIFTSQINCLNLFVYSRNNPINCIELEGRFSAVLSMSLATTMAAKFTALCASIKAMVASFWNIFVIVGLVIAVALIVYSINKTAKQILSKMEKAIKENHEKNRKSFTTQVIYVLMKPKCKVSDIFYVGRTKNYHVRYLNHKHNKEFDHDSVVFTCDTKEEARVMEQATLSACLVEHIFQMGVGQSNKMRGLSLKKIKNFGKEIKKLASLLTCTAESDFLNLIGK